jgi:hypothetical protein
MMYGKILLNPDEIGQAFLNIGLMSDYCCRQEIQGKASSRITSPRLGFEMDSTLQQIMCFTTDLIS